MAAELTVSAISIAFVKSGSGSVSITLPALTIDVAGVQANDTQQLIATSDTAITRGDVAGAAWMFIQNLDAANYVEFKPAAAGTVTLKILKGEWVAVRLGSGALAPVLIANTAACNCRIIQIDL